MHNIELTTALLVVGGLAMAISLWRAHKDRSIQFNLLDLLLENGKVSKISFAFMLVLSVTTWVILHMTLNGKITDTMFSTYGMMWVAPLVAKVVFAKNEPPSGTTITTSIQQTEKTTP